MAALPSLKRMYEKWLRHPVEIWMSFDLLKGKVYDFFHLLEIRLLTFHLKLEPEQRPAYQRTRRLFQFGSTFVLFLAIQKP